MREGYSIQIRRFSPNTFCWDVFFLHNLIHSEMRPTRQAAKRAGELFVRTHYVVRQGNMYRVMEDKPGAVKVEGPLSTPGPTGLATP